MSKRLLQIIQDRLDLPPQQLEKISRLSGGETADFAGQLIKRKLITEAQMLTARSILYDIPFQEDLPAGDNYNDIVDKLGGTDASARLEIEKLVHVLLDRKRTLFAGDKRMIINYKIVEEPEGPRLLVMSTLVKDS